MHLCQANHVSARSTRISSRIRPRYTTIHRPQSPRHAMHAQPVMNTRCMIASRPIIQLPGHIFGSSHLLYQACPSKLWSASRQLRRNADRGPPSAPPRPACQPASPVGSRWRPPSIFEETRAETHSDACRLVGLELPAAPPPDGTLGLKAVSLSGRPSSTYLWHVPTIITTWT